MPAAPRVLIVDDSRLTRTIIKDALASAGYEVVGEAVNGHEGIDMAGKLKPDLVTVDFTMPGKGGLESLDEIRAAHPATKVIAVTALGSQKLLEEDARKAGAMAVINKPFSPFHLVKVADGLLGRVPGPKEPKGLVLPVSQPTPDAVAGGLTTEQIADLMEVGNIGAGNAASSLSNLIRQRCLISPPQVAFLKPDDLLAALGSDDYLMVSLGIRILGDIPAAMVVVLKRDQAAAVVRYMTGGDKGVADFSLAALSALKQAGEFLTRAFSKAVNQFLLNRADAGPELAAADSSRGLEDVLKEGGKGTEPFLLIHCGFSDAAQSFEGKLAYILSGASQRTVLTRIKDLLIKK
jgi:two-component system, chemotaxis family, chemotaxis protein CheY